MARYSHDSLAENSSQVNKKQIRHFSNTMAAFSYHCIVSVGLFIVHMCMRMRNMSINTVSNYYVLATSLKDNANLNDHSTTIVRNSTCHCVPPIPPIVHNTSPCTFLPALPIWYANQCSTDVGSTDCPHLHSVELA